MDQSGELDTRNVPGRAVNALKIPDGLCTVERLAVHLISALGSQVRVGVDLVQEPSSVVFVEDACESPRMVLKGLDVVDLDAEHVAGLRALDLKWA